MIGQISGGCMNHHSSHAELNVVLADWQMDELSDELHELVELARQNGLEKAAEFVEERIPRPYSYKEEPEPSPPEGLAFLTD